ncbi:hypothetical protein R6Q57_007703 [Mikania cordata]
MFCVHQFEKLEQFCITNPDDNESWDMHEDMIKTVKICNQVLRLPYQAANVVFLFGALNDAAVKKYDLEAWFPAQTALITNQENNKQDMDRLVMWSNVDTKQYCHLLNSILTATETTTCCILENYQKEDDVEVPIVLQRFMAIPVKETKWKKLA